MRIRLVLVLLVAAGCGGDTGSGPGRGDYFTQLARVTETATIQERGLERDLRVRMEEASVGEDRFAALLVYVDQSARLYQDVVDALGALDPPSEVAGEQEAYAEVWRSRVALMTGVRDAGLQGPNPILELLDQEPFDEAAADARARCEDLQSAVAAAGSNVDLVCDGRPD